MKYGFVRRPMVLVLFMAFSFSAFAENREPRIDHGVGASVGGVVVSAGSMLVLNFMLGAPAVLLPLIVEGMYWTDSGIGFGLESSSLLQVSAPATAGNMDLYPSIRWRRSPEAVFSMYLVPFSANVFFQIGDNAETGVAVGFGRRAWVSNRDEVVTEFWMSRIGATWTWRPWERRYISLSTSVGAGFFPLDLSLTTGWTW
ncbi:hypothetical protein [Spirochaeta dissipatitropha]